MKKKVGLYLEEELIAAVQEVAKLVKNRPGPVYAAAVRHFLEAPAQVKHAALQREVLSDLDALLTVKGGRLKGAVVPSTKRDPQAASS